MRVGLRPLVDQIDALDETIAAFDSEIAASFKADETAERSMTIRLPRPDPAPEF